ncbi:MAG TPA: protein-glutamate O-methyltransferase CheR, partial [Marinagarivorans sp.]|nr:protein-glutamate O-methyltransferase CheR [Marinagarivorans sp.]
MTEFLSLQQRDREFPMSQANFNLIKNLAYTWTGIKLSDHKENMIYGRLARRLRALNMADFDQYCALLQSEDEQEKREFINSITTNLTSFFREPHHFDFLKNQLLPGLLQRNQSTRKIRIWSAGCSTGEEPHSIAMVVASIAELKHWDVKILATDLDSNVLERASGGIYSLGRFDAFPSSYKQFIKKSADGEQVKIADSVRGLIRFNQLNLLQAWPMKGSFDIIFCRNVVIYFDLETQRKLFN